MCGVMRKLSKFDPMSRASKATDRLTEKAGLGRLPRMPTMGDDPGVLLPRRPKWSPSKKAGISASLLSAPATYSGGS